MKTRSLIAAAAMLLAPLPTLAQTFPPLRLRRLAVSLCSRCPMPPMRWSLQLMGRR